SLAAEARDEPGLLAELASSYSQLGRLQRNTLGADLGDTAAAVASHARALALRQRVVDARPDDPAARRAVAESHMPLGAALRAQGDLDGAVRHYRLSEQSHAPGAGLSRDEQASRLHHHAVTLVKIGIAETMRGRHNDAAGAFAESLRINRELLALDPADSV